MFVVVPVELFLFCTTTAAQQIDLPSGSLQSLFKLNDSKETSDIWCMIYYDGDVMIWWCGDVMLCMIYVVWWWWWCEDMMYNMWCMMKRLWFIIHIWCVVWCMRCMMIWCMANSVWCVHIYIISCQEKVAS